MQSRPDPTPYADVNAVVHTLLDRVRSTLGDDLVGMYLTGSLADGDFDPGSSDIDFVAVTRGNLSIDQCQSLHAMHADLAISSLVWGAKIEGDYIPRDATRRFDPDNALYPRVSVGGRFNVEQHDSDEVIQRHVMRQHGIVLCGPSPPTLIDPIQPDDLRDAVQGILRGWWSRQLDHPTFLQTREYQAFAVLTMCRSLYLLHHGSVISKPAAARWALEALDGRWHGLIQLALVWRGDTRHDITRLPETLDLIRFTLEQATRPAERRRPISRASPPRP